MYNHHSIVQVSLVMLITLMSVMMIVTARTAVDAGQPLILSQYLPHQADKARELCQVNDIGNSTSYSGFFTVDEHYNSNMFFWFFPSLNNNPRSPILLWLNGGPGASSLLGLFQENGPFTVAADGVHLIANPYTWAQQFNMLYIDNPCGAGFSFTQSVDGYVTNEDEVAFNLYSTLVQFFMVFPDYAKNDFYVTGESYAGKYIPSIAYKIHEMNQNSKNPFINLKGISIGDGMMDPLTQTQGYADMWYQLSLADENQVNAGRQFEQQIKLLIERQDWVRAFHVFDAYLNGDFFKYPTFYVNATGLSSYMNYLTPSYPPNPYESFLALNSTRAAIHVGSVPYVDYNQTVEFYLISDWMKSIADKMPTLMDNYKVMIYNGQLDIILAGPLAENFIRTIKWSGQQKYLNASRIIWKVQPSDAQVAGYVRQVGGFVQALVRAAGHLVPQDQPRAALDLIQRFVNNIPFNQ